MAHQCCPLCKRQLPASSAGNTLDTRLCEQCQTMVLTAFRGADSMVAASAVVVPQGVAIVQGQREASVVDQPQVGAPTFFEDIATVAPGFEQEAQHSMASDSRDDLRFEFIEDEDPADRIQTIGADLSGVAGNGSSHHDEGLFEEFEQSIRFPEPTPHHDYAETDDSHLAESTKSDSGSIGATLVEDRSEEPRSIGEASPADPWEDPLPAWDYSHSEWPVLVGPNKRKSFKKLGWLIAAIVLLACAAGFYLLIYRPSGPQRRTATDSGTAARVSAVEPRATAAGSADSDARKRVPATASDSPASAASPAAETVARESVAPKESSNAQGRFSLQAAAFPTQVGADEFAEKLKRTGLPSYVVPAELERRGKWFRVRVGRFNAAEEAQRFAGEAQQRARAAGLNVQLIVCQYDQP
jgi:cell division septation protein DedD